MKFIIKSTQQGDAITELELQQDGDHVRVIATDQGGVTWYILSVSPEGVRLNSGLPDRFPVDSSRKMKIIG